MTTAALDPKIEYLEDGVTLAFAVPFRFLASSDLVVSRVAADGTVTSLAEGVAWSATGGGTDAGGTLTLVASVAGSTLRIRRRTARSQQTDYVAEDTFPAETHEAALDRLTLIAQEQDVDIDDTAARALMVPDGETASPLPSKAELANKYLVGDASGNLIPSTGTGADAGLRADLAGAAGAELSGFSHATPDLAGTIGAKLKAVVSITDAPYSAVGGDTGNQTAAIQAAVDAINALGGGTLVVPQGETYRVTGTITLYSNITLQIDGTIHMVNTTSLTTFSAIGTVGALLSNIHITGGGEIVGDATFAAGVPSVNNGSAHDFQFVSDSSVKGVKITGFALNGTAFANGDNNIVLGSTVDRCGQNIAFYATTRDTFGNKAIGNTSTNCGTFNALHSEGNAAGGTKKNYGIVFADNVIDDPYGLGINVENSPEAVVIGNRERGAGPGTGAALKQGIMLFGSPNSIVVGNVSTGNAGYGIVIGAGSSATAVSGNSTSGNTLGGCLVTDGNGDATGIAATNNIAMGINAFTEGDVAVAGNHSFLNRTKNFKFSNVAVADATTLDWFEKGGSFVPVAEGTTAAGVGTYTFQTGRFTRIGDIVLFSLQVGWSAHTGTGDLKISGLPYAGFAVHAQPVTPWINNVPIPAGQHFQASIPQSGSHINIQTYADTSGAAAGVVIPAVADAILISGSYLV